MSDFLLLILFGYLIGSISPGYFLGRIIKGVDIRKYGPNKNTGATNAYHVLGKGYGIITGFIDAIKAIFVYLVGIYGFLKIIPPVNPNLAIFIGLAAVFGHIYPFYLNFKGGMGVASLIGLNFIVLFFTRSFFALGLFIGTIVYFLIMTKRPGVQEMLRQNSLRRVLKLAGLALPLSYIVLDQSLLLMFIGILLLVSIIFDLIRFISPGFNKVYLNLRFLSKEKESKTFSGYSFFLLSGFILFAFFPKEIAIASLVFFILGDVFAPLVRKWFWPKLIAGDKTLGGAILIFGLSFVAGVFLNSLTVLSLSLKFILIGAVSTAIFDLLSFWFDDNLLVPLGTATLLAIFV